MEIIEIINNSAPSRDRKKKRSQARLTGAVMGEKFSRSTARRKSKSTQWRIYFRFWRRIKFKKKAPNARGKW